MNKKQAVITVIGDYAVGMTMECNEFPQAGETVKGRNFRRLHGGKGSNQAIGAARLGAHTVFGGCLGNDGFGDDALAMMKAEGMDVTHVLRTDKDATGVGVVIVNASGNNEIVIGLGAAEHFLPADVDAMLPAIKKSDILLLQLEMNLDAVAHAIEVAHGAGTPVILNPAPFSKIPDQYLKQATYLTPNETEAAAMLGLDSIPDGAELARRLHAAYGATAVVTLGEKGAYVKSADADELVPGVAVEAVDTTGAGDTFSAALAVGLGEGMELLDAVRFANRAAALSVTVKGVVESIPARAQVEAFK